MNDMHLCCVQFTINAVGAASQCYRDELMLLKCELMLLKCEIMLLKCELMLLKCEVCYQNKRSTQKIRKHCFRKLIV